MDSYQNKEYKSDKNNCVEEKKKLLKFIINNYFNTDKGRGPNDIEIDENGNEVEILG